MWPVIGVVRARPGGWAVRKNRERKKLAKEKVNALPGEHAISRDVEVENSAQRSKVRDRLQNPYGDCVRNKLGKSRGDIL